MLAIFLMATTSFYAMKRRIFLHGKFRKLLPLPVEIDASTVAEAISGLCVVTGSVLKPKPGQGKHLVQIVGFSTPEAINRPLRDDELDLHIVPAFVGGKSGGIFQIVIGIVLVVVATIVSYGSASGWAASVAFGMSAGTVATMGAMMVVGGLLSLISQSPSASFDNSSSSTESSRYLGTPSNTTKVGTRIPFGYGRMRVYGQILSMNIDAKDVAV